MNTRIRDLRIAMNMTKEQFAKAIGTTLELINQIGNNEIMVSEQTIIFINNIFNVDIRYYNQSTTSLNNLKTNAYHKNETVK